MEKIIMKIEKIKTILLTCLMILLYCGIFTKVKGAVILLFDNEQKSDRPLKKFLTHSDVKMDAGQIFKQLKANLFLQTIPLANGLEECEIEDLYQKEVLNVIINGKKFCRNAEYDSEKYFGKHIFSMYIMKHYNEVDFSKFLPILDSINSLI